MDVVEVPVGLELVVSEADERAERLRVSVLLHEPAGRFGAEVDEDGEGQRWDEGGSKLQTPRNVARVGDHDVCNETEEDTKSLMEQRMNRRVSRVSSGIIPLKNNVVKGWIRTVQSCQPMTRAPRICAGEFSAAKTGTVDPLAPMPIPRRRRTMKSSHQFWVKPDAMG